MNTSGLPDWFFPGVVAPLLVALITGAAIAFFKVNNQVAVLSARSEHDTPEDDASREEVARALNERIDDQALMIRQLQSELREERDARQASERRYTREIADLNEQLASANTRLAVMRQQMQNRGDSTT